MSYTDAQIQNTSKQNTKTELKWKIPHEESIAQLSVQKKELKFLKTWSLKLHNMNLQNTTAFNL